MINFNDGLSDAEFIEEMKTYRADHEPDGWPAIQMKDLDRLIKIAEKGRRYAT